MEGGVLAGYEMVDVKATLYDGSYHEVDSNEMAFKIAGSMAFKEAARKASPVLLEPVMSVEVVVPEEYMGTIIGDLNSRRGRIEGIEHRAGSQVIKSMVPLAEMFGYATNMRSNTQGRATFSMHFCALRRSAALGGGGDRGQGAGQDGQQVEVQPAARVTGMRGAQRLMYGPSQRAGQRPAAITKTELESNGEREI